MPQASEEVLNQIAERAKFSALPEVMARLLGMFDDPETTATQVSEILGKDAGLVTRLLRVANSAYYGGSGNVATVQQAVVKLGFRTTKAVVLSSAVYSTVNGSVPRDIDLRPFWQHGLEVAITAMSIADEVCPKYSDETFVAGLLHDIGRVALAVAFPDPFRELLQAAPGQWTRGRESELFGVDHCEAGAFLCDRWNLPELLTESVRAHHDQPEALPDAAPSRVALCVGLADSMSSVSWAGPAASRTECRQFREVASALVGMDANRLQQIEAQAQPQMEQWADLLEIELCPVTELLARANQRLFKLYQAMDELNRDNEKLHAQLLAKENERAALDALRVICATFSHHINNATTTILGRAQLVNLALSRAERDAGSEKIVQSMTVIENAVDTITEVLTELKSLTRFDTVSYHGRAEIIKLKRDIAAAVDSS
jgi:putative nucleotidyltransferase with HDIG domain